MEQVLVMNTLVESLFVYICLISELDEKIIQNIQMEILKFIWQGKKAKISFSTLKCPKKGGLKLVDLRAKHKALLCQWIFNIHDNYLTKSMYEILNPNINSDVWYINAKHKMMRLIFDLVSGVKYCLVQIHLYLTHDCTSEESVPMV